MMNHQIDQLGDYAFRRLERLIEGIAPATNEAPLKMSLGEPQHAPPALLADTLAANAHLLLDDGIRRRQHDPDARLERETIASASVAMARLWVTAPTNDKRSAGHANVRRWF